MKKITSLLGCILIGAAAIAAPARPPGASFSPALGSLQSAFGPKSVVTSQPQNARTVLAGDAIGNAADGTSSTYTARVQPRNAGRFNAPSSLSGASLSAWMGPTESESAGYYSFGTDGSYDMLWSNELAQYGFNLTNAWLRQGRLCGLAVYNIGGLIFGYNYVELDPSTGRPLKEESIGPNNTIDLGTYYHSCAYVPEEDRIYGYSQTADGKGFNFSSSPAQKIGDLKVISQLDELSSRANALCYNPADGYLYGVTFNGDFVRISRDGTQTQLFNLGIEGLKNDKSALIYSPYDGCFIYTPIYYYYATQLYYIYPESGEMRFIRNFPTDNQFFFLVDNAFTYEPTAPAAPQEVSRDIAPGATTGTLTLQLPSVNADGSPIAEEGMEWTYYLDNTPVGTYPAYPGHKVTFQIGPVESGEHVVRVSCKADGKEGYPYVLRAYFGNGMPMEPENVVLTSDRVSWDAVDKAILGGWLEPGKMRYEVYINDRFIGSTDQTSMDISLDPTVPVSAYYAYVAASCNSQVSGQTRSNKIIFGAPFDLPYTVEPTQEQADLTQVFNLDGSPEYGIWEYWESRWHEPVFASGWNQTQADDWLILPPVNCPDLSHAYRVTLDAICGGMTGKDERFEVWCGNAPDPSAMNTLIIPETKVTEFITEGWETFTNLFVPKESGSTYIAIRAVSPAEQKSLIVRRIIIEATDEVADVAGAPEDLRVERTDDAALQAVISFKTPSVTIAGNPISGQADMQVHARVGDLQTAASCTPGREMTLTVDTRQGENRIEVYCSIDGQAGQSASTSVFTGTIVPDYVENLTSAVSRDNLGITLCWDPPLGGRSDLEGYYSDAGIHYVLMELQEDPEYGDADWVETRDLGNVAEFTYTVPSGTPQHVKYLGIAAANAAGTSPCLWYVAHLIGTPYEPEISEDFDGGAYPALHYGPIGMPSPSADYNGSWAVAYPEEVIEDAWDPEIPYALVAYATEDAGGKARLTLPKFSTEGVENPALTLLLWNTEPCGTVEVFASTYGAPRFEYIHTVTSMDDGWQRIVIPMPGLYHDMPWIQIAIDAILPDYDTFTMLGGYAFGTAPTDGVGTLQSPGALLVRGGKGEVLVNGLGSGDEMLEVYSMDGRCVARNRAASSEMRIALPAGIYMVRCGGLAAKVTVR
ncbi:MAG: hypothetical protein K2O78_01525 [Muribaculaceae bacterium]|nr:hypothetical protein [Muribaculaceae bacterium]